MFIEWLESQGIELSKEEQLPQDPYMEKEYWKGKPIPKKMKAKEDPLRRFLEYDGKVLAFDVLWDDRDMPHGELVKYKMFYFLQDDTISIKELHDGRGGKDPFPVLLKKMKLPKKWKEKPVTFPSIVLETTEEEVQTYYVPNDLIVGETIFVLGRRFLIYDCDPFTRHYYKTMLGIEQPPRLEIPQEPKKEFPRTFPPHIGIGAPEDSLQSCFGLMPKPPYKDLIRYNLNANKHLRYLCELDEIHPEDIGRKFILKFSLADSTVIIEEIPRRNSGRREGRFLKSMKLQLPDSDPNFPTYYTPDKFFIGAVIPVFKHRFKIVGCDLFVYRYMSSNPDKFPQEVIDNVRNYHMREGNLKEELESAAREEHAAETRAQLAKIGQQAVAEPSAMEKCLQALDVEEGSVSPSQRATAPPTTDRISYDEALRESRLSKPCVCDQVLPLKGILRSGAMPKDDQQKVVCFTGPAAGEHRETPKPKKGFYPSGQQPHFDTNPDFCERYKEPNWEQREEWRRNNECQYDIVPKRVAEGSNYEPDTDKKKQLLPGYLGSFNIDHKEVPEHMRLPPDAYEKVKYLRKEVPDISPAATRIADYPRLSPPRVDTCVHPPPEQTGPCAPRQEEDVAFACPHVEPILPCCPEDKHKEEDKEKEQTKL
ncbi:hypothetical protein O0L34_g12431 [Tuta absoluta]|nr:hypothetical protein O0L34_g12425 [Tuta absoluta]KAJ2946392.1 hypothetical protein O0L34_g12431 [Tuta absoluta]